MIPLDRQRILFVAGKGGVGKTTTAAAVALNAAERCRRCLVVSTDPAHSLGDIFDRRIGDRIESLFPGLSGIEIDPEAQADRYIDGVKRTMRRFMRPEMYPEIDRQMAMTRLAPGAMEAALMERVATIVNEESRRYDLVVFDTAPTGHTLRLLSLPEIMAAWTDGLLRHRKRSDDFGRALRRLRRRPADDAPAAIGTHDPEEHDEEDGPTREVRELLLARRRALAETRRILLDPGTCAVLLVLIPEKLPILESRKALEALRGFAIPVAGLVVNRVLPATELGVFLEARREQEARYRAMIDSLFPDLPRAEVPLLPRDVTGPDGLREVARHLFDETVDTAGCADYERCKP